MGFGLTIGKLLNKLMDWMKEKMEPTQTENKASPPQESKLSKIIQTVAAYAIAGIIIIFWNTGAESKDRIKVLEERVSFLYQDKVSRAEFREEMTQVRLQIEGTKTDIVTRQDSMKSDILGRLDLIAPLIRKER